MNRYTIGLLVMVAAMSAFMSTGLSMPDGEQGVRGGAVLAGGRH